MSDVPISLYTSVVKLTGENVAPPSLPPSLEETQPAINPPGTSDISGLVPYNGAIDNVNLGEKGLSTGFVQYDNTPTDTPTGSGTVVWNPDKYTLDLSMGLGDSVQQIGMETYYTPVKNQTGGLIPDGTFVMATGSLGASGRITVAPAVTDGSVDSRYMLGVTTHDLADGEDGLVTWFGEIRGFNTNTKAPVGETWVDGTVLWNNPAVAGGFTNIEPQAPNLKIPVAIVISAGNNGVIFIRPRLGMRLTDLHDVDAFTPSDKDLISYDSALGHWNAKSLGSVIGGTSSQFLKGDGSLDSNSYALASSISGTTNYLSKFTASGTIGNSAVFESGGNVGIGTTSQIEKLTIADVGINALGVYRDADVNVVGTAGQLIYIGAKNGTTFTPGAAIVGALDNPATTGFLDLQTRSSNSLTTKLRIASSGNVLIGTTTDNGARLQVSGGGYFSNSVTASSFSINNGSLSNSGFWGTLISAGSGSFADFALINSATNAIMYNRTGTLNMIFVGNLLIGTTTDNGARLQVNGNQTISASGNVLKLNGGDTGIANTNWISFFESNETVRQGFIGFGSTGNSHLQFLNDTPTGDLVFYTQTIERMRITSSGNVGINTTSPTNTLDVNGTARIRTLSNATGDFVTASATGVLQKRTASETLADIGGIGGTIATGQVAFGTGVNTIGGNADFVWDNSSKYLNILVSGTQIARLGNGIGTLQGVLQLYTSAGVENIRLRAGSISYINNTFGFGIGTTSPTNALDVAGQTRIRTIANGDGYFLTKNSNGVITASQSLYQLSTSVGIGLTNPSGGLHIRRDSLYNAEGNTSLIIDGGSVVGAVKLLIGVDTTNDVAYIESMQASTGWNKNLSIQAMGGLVGIATISPTNTLDVNGTARIRSLTGTTGYLTLLSSTGVMGQSVAYNADTGIVINGTFLPSGAVFSVNGVSYFNNWATAGAYDKLSIDFGENRGFGYDTTTNEIFVKGITTVPVKIDTDAPTDSLNVLSTGGVEMKNLQAGTISDNIGLNSSGELVKGVAGLVQSVSGTAVDNTDPLNPIVSVDNWTFETLIDTITLNDTNGNVTYTCNSTITIFTNSKLNIKTLYLNITNIASSGIPLGGAFEIKGYNFYNFIGANDISVLYEVKEFRGTSYTESLLPLLRPDALGTFDGQLIFRKINNTQQQPPFTSTNGEITIKIAKFKQS